MSQNKLRAEKFKGISRELASMHTHSPTLNDICWMARSGELLKPGQAPLDHEELASHLFGPSMCTVQNTRIEVKELDEYGRVVWEA